MPVNEVAGTPGMIGIGVGENKAAVIRQPRSMGIVDGRSQGKTSAPYLGGKAWIVTLGDPIEFWGCCDGRLATVGLR